VASERDEEFFRKFLPDHPGRWLSDRFSLALVRQGQILDRELCTLKLAFMPWPEDSPEIRSVVRAVESGEYRYIKLSDTAVCGHFLALEAAVAR